MVMLAGAVTSDGEQRSAHVARALARRTARYPQLRERLLVSDDHVTLYGVERVEDRPRVSSWKSADGSQTWLLGDANYYPERSTRQFDGASLEQLLQSQAVGRWLAVQLDFRRGTLRFATDRLGLAWLYIGRIRNGYVFSGDFAAVAQEMKDGLTVDRDNMMLELALGYVPDDGTVFREIELAPAGAVFELFPTALARPRTRVIYGDRYAGLTDRQKFERLDGIYDEVMREAIKPVESRLVLSISGGYDSRYALAFLKRYKVAPPLCTFGHPDSDEVRAARAICAKVGWTTDLFSLEEGDWEQWRRGIQQLGNSGMVQWSGWAETWLMFLRSHGAFPVIGYLGDALSGKHLGTAPPQDGNWVAHWQQWSTKGGWVDSPLLLPAARSRMQACLKERLENLAAQSSTTFPYQQGLHLDLYGRQRRWVATQPNVMSRFVTPVLFFYTPLLLDFWSNLPEQDLLGQRLYKAYAESRFGGLFPPRDSQRSGRIARTLRRALTAAAKATRRKPEVPASIVIDHKRILVPNRDRIASLIDRVAPMVDDVVDVGGFRDQVRQFADSRTIPSNDMIRAINVLLLLDVVNEVRSGDSAVAHGSGV